MESYESLMCQIWKCELGLKVGLDSYICNHIPCTVR